MASHAEVQCEMDFSSYPFDTQNCKFVMSTATVSKYLGRLRKEIRKNIHFQNITSTWFYLQEFETKIDYKTVSNKTETFDLTFMPLEEESVAGISRTGFKVSMRRIATPFFINTYVPSGVLTMISFIGFVIPVDKVRLTTYMDWFKFHREGAASKEFNH